MKMSVTDHSQHTNRQQSTENAQVSFRRSRDRRNRSASPSTDRRTTTRSRNYRDKDGWAIPEDLPHLYRPGDTLSDVLQRIRIHKYEQERIWADEKKTRKIDQETTGQKDISQWPDTQSSLLETIERERAERKAAVDKMMLDMDTSNVTPVSPSKAQLTEANKASKHTRPENLQTASGESNVGMVDETLDKTFRDSAIDLSKDNDVQKVTLNADLDLCSDYNDSNDGSFTDEAVCLTLTKDHEKERVLDSPIHDLTPVHGIKHRMNEFIAPSGFDMPKLVTEPVIMSDKGKGKRKKEQLHPEDDGYVPSIVESYAKSMGEEYDGMLGSFKADLSVRLGNSVASQEKPNDMSDSSSYSGSDGEDDALLQVALYLSLQKRSSGDGAQSSGTVVSDSVSSAQHEQASVRDVLSTSHTNLVDTTMAAKEEVVPKVTDVHPLAEKRHSLAYSLGLITVEELQKLEGLLEKSEEERFALIKQYLQANQEMLKTYGLGSETRHDSDGRIRTHSVIGRSWYTKEGRVELCGAIKWLDALLRFDEPGIILEDELILWPQMRALKDKIDKIGNASEADWNTYHQDAEKVKNSNKRRNELLAATGLSPTIFEDLLFPAQVCAPNEHGEGVEEPSLEALRDSLNLILDTIRFNNCNWMKDPSTESDVVSEGYGRNFVDGMKGVDFPDFSVYRRSKWTTVLDGSGRVSSTPQLPTQRTNSTLSESISEFMGTYNFYKAGSHKKMLVRKYFGRRNKFMLPADTDWKLTFPPTCWIPLPTGEVVKVRDDHKEIPEISKQWTDQDKTKLLRDLDPNEMLAWMHSYRDHFHSLQAVVTKCSQECRVFRSLTTKQEEDKLLEMQKYEQCKMEKQLWYRDHSITILRRMQKFIKDWQTQSPYGPTNKGPGPIATLLAELDNLEAGMKTFQSNVPVEFPYIKGFCPRVNQLGGCEPFRDGLCCFSHEKAGQVCRFGKKCSYGASCRLAHPERLRKRSRPENILVVPSFQSRGTSPGLTPGSANRPCPHVNQAGGCQDKKANACAYHHDNENTECFGYKLPSGCPHGDRCAYLHRPPDATVSDQDRDLKPLLKEVLQNPKKFRVCMFANDNKYGCVKGGNCLHNHSLEGVECLDRDSSGKCPRQGTCPLLHTRMATPMQWQQPNVQLASQAPVQHVIPGSKRLYGQDAMDQSVVENIDQKRSRPSEISPSTADFQRYREQPTQRAYNDTAAQGYDHHGQTMTANWRSQDRHQSGQQAPINAPTGPRNTQPQSVIKASGGSNGLRGRQDAAPRQKVPRQPHGSLIPQNAPTGPQAERSGYQTPQVSAPVQPQMKDPSAPRAEQGNYKAPRGSMSGHQQARQRPDGRQHIDGFSILGAAGPNQHRVIGLGRYQAHHHTAASGGQKRGRSNDGEGMVDADDETSEAKRARQMPKHNGRNRNNHGRGSGRR
jgi:hypothetical protein